MFRLWVKEWKNTRMIRDITICDDSADTRTHKIFRALEEACHAFNISKPIWLDMNIREFGKLSKTRFSRDSFMEEVPFDYLEIHVIEEDPESY